MNHPRNHCVLVVDDVVDNLLLLQLILESEGYRVELATDGKTALSKVQKALPSLVLLDVMMPVMNGFEVTQRLRQLRDCLLLPIVLVTADRSVDFDRALTVGANDVIRKPIDMNELLARVGHWLAQKT